jgi:cell division protein FtsB
MVVLEELKKLRKQREELVSQIAKMNVSTVPESTYFEDNRDEVWTITGPGEFKMGPHIEETRHKTKQRIRKLEETINKLKKENIELSELIKHAGEEQKLINSFLVKDLAKANEQIKVVET